MHTLGAAGKRCTAERLIFPNPQHEIAQLKERSSLESNPGDIRRSIGALPRSQRRFPARNLYPDTGRCQELSSEWRNSAQLFLPDLFRYAARSFGSVCPSATGKPRAGLARKCQMRNRARSAERQFFGCPIQRGKSGCRQGYVDPDCFVSGLDRNQDARLFLHTAFRGNAIERAG